MTDSRERLYDALLEATGESTKSKAIDTAVGYYLEMAGDNPAHPTGRVAKLMQLAEDQGSVTAAEIAETLNTRELSVEHEENWSVGNAE